MRSPNGCNTMSGSAHVLEHACAHAYTCKNDSCWSLASKSGREGISLFSVWCQISRLIEFSSFKEVFTSCSLGSISVKQ